MGLNGNIPRFGPEVEVNLRSIPAFRPSAPDAAGDLLMGVSNMLNGVVRNATRIHQAQVEEEATQAGKEAGAASDFDPNNLPQEMTIAAQAYRKAAEQSFSTQLEMAQDETFNRFQLEYEQTPEAERDPVSYAARFKTYIDETAAKLPGHMKPAYLELGMAKVNPIILNATKGHLRHTEEVRQKDAEALFELKRKQVEANLLPKNEVEQKAYAVAVAELMESAKAAGKTPNQLLLLKNEIETATTKKAKEELLETFQSAFETAPNQFEYARDFESTLPEKLGLTPEEHKDAVDYMQARLGDDDFFSEKAFEQLDWESQTAIKADIEQLHVDADSGDLSQAELTRRVKALKDYLKPDEAADILGKGYKARQEKAKKAADIQGVLDGSAAFDPNSSEGSGLLEKAVDQIMNGGEGATLPLQGVISSGFGVNRIDHRHGGIDIAASLGTPSKAVLSGTVEYAGPKGSFGNVVIIRHPDGYQSYYAHASEVLVKTGQKVQGGQAVIKVGSTGRSTGPHLHWEVRDPNGKPVDPMGYLNRQPKRSTASTAEEKEKAVKQLMLRYKVAPPQIKNQIVSGIYGTPEQQKQSMLMYQWLYENRVNIKMSAQDGGILKRARQEMEDGKTYDVALAIAKKDLDPDNINKKEFYKARLHDKQTGLLKLPANRPDRLFSGGMPVTTGVAAGINALWDKEFERAFLMTGREETARVDAEEAVRKVFDYSRVAGNQPTVMKFPPEKHYTLAGYSDEQNAAWIRRQLDADLKPFNLKSENVYLVPDPVTAKKVSNGERPDYRIMYMNKSGHIVDLMKGDEYVTFAPSIDEEVKHLKAERLKQSQQAVNNARDQRTQAAKPKPVYYDMRGK